jgi:hypothetical protein
MPVITLSSCCRLHVCLCVTTDVAKKLNKFTLKADQKVCCFFMCECPSVRSISLIASLKQQARNQFDASQTTPSMQYRTHLTGMKELPIKSKHKKYRKRWYCDVIDEHKRGHGYMGALHTHTHTHTPTPHWNFSKSRLIIMQ